jgi:hypothetical protein
LQADDCSNCGQGNVVPIYEQLQEHSERDVGASEIEVIGDDFDADFSIGIGEDEQD